MVVRSLYTITLCYFTLLYFYVRGLSVSLSLLQDVNVDRRQAQAIASLPDSITHYYAYSNEDITVISLRLPVPCISERKLYMISWLSQNLSNLVLKVI